MFKVESKWAFQSFCTCHLVLCTWHDITIQYIFNLPGNLHDPSFKCALECICPNPPGGGGLALYNSTYLAVNMYLVWFGHAHYSLFQLRVNVWIWFIWKGRGSCSHVTFRVRNVTISPMLAHCNSHTAPRRLGCRPGVVWKGFCYRFLAVLHL